MMCKSSLGHCNGHTFRDDRPTYDELTDTEKRAAQGRDTASRIEAGTAARNMATMQRDKRFFDIYKAYLHANEAGRDRLYELAIAISDATVPGAE
jgi:hypothetical protein